MRWLMAVVVATALIPAGAGSLTIEEATSRALAANPRVQAARLAALAAQERAREAAGRRYGEVDLVGSYNHYESDRLVRPISIDLFKDPARGFYQLPWDRNQVHYGIAYEIPLLAAGSLHEGRLIAELAQRASENLVVFGEAEIRYNVRATFRNALALGHALVAAGAYEQALSRDAADADLKVKVGTWASVDAAKVHFVLENAHAQREALQAQLAWVEASLAALMAEERPGGGYDLADVPAEPVASAAGSQDDFQAALTGRRDLAAVRNTVAIAERKSRLAREVFGPQVAIAGNFLTNRAPGADGSLATHEIGLYVKLPLFKGLQRVHALHAADWELRFAEQQERSKELEISTQVQDATSRLQAARAQLIAGKAQRALGAEVARVEHLKLEQGAGRMEDYLAARVQEMQGETSYWQGLYALQSAFDYADFVSARGGQHE